MTESEQPAIDRAADVVQAGARGAVGAMAMTGLRTLTESLGLVGQTPPQAIFHQRLGLMMDLMPKGKQKGLKGLMTKGRRKAVRETAHIAFGAGAGAGFGVLPPSVCRSAWAGPVYGLTVWLGYELAIAPALGLGHAGKRKPLEHVALAADHLLYGQVLSEARRPPRG